MYTSKLHNFHCLPMECMEFHHPSIAHWDRGPSGFCTAYHWVMFNTTAVTSISVLGETAVVGQAVVRGKVGAVGKLWDGPTFVYLCYSILWFYTIFSSSRLMVWTSIFSFIWFMIYFKSLKSHPLQMAKAMLECAGGSTETTSDIKSHHRTTKLYLRSSIWRKTVVAYSVFPKDVFCWFILQQLITEGVLADIYYYLYSWLSIGL